MDWSTLLACIISLVSVVWLSFSLMRTRAALRVAILELSEIEDYDKRVKAHRSVSAVLGDEASW